MDFLSYLNSIIANTRVNFSPSQFIAGPSPRGGWPIRPYSRSKYYPMNETADCQAAQRRRKQRC